MFPDDRHTQHQEQGDHGMCGFDFDFDFFFDLFDADACAVGLSKPCSQRIPFIE